MTLIILVLTAEDRRPSPALGLDPPPPLSKGCFPKRSHCTGKTRQPSLCWESALLCFLLGLTLDCQTSFLSFPTKSFSLTEAQLMAQDEDIRVAIPLLSRNMWSSKFLVMIAEESASRPLLFLSTLETLSSPAGILMLSSPRG